MKQLFIQKGKAIIEEVPAPIISDDEILIRVHYSCISAGTEIYKIKASGRSLYRKILEKPQNAKKVLGRLKSHGIGVTIIKVKGKIESKNPIGYSASGIVLKTGKNVKRIKQGDRVACAGDKIANHSEFISVPENLTVKIPQNLSLKSSSTVALGSVALQGIRRCNPKLGEYVAVIGLGNLGQIVVQLLNVNGCSVIGIDLEKNRIDRAISLGMRIGFNPKNVNIVDEVFKSTNGHGADSVMITAASESKEVINQAMKMCRKKGKVVVVGNINLDLDRDIFYQKELDILISTSYGPGRYEERYEKDGYDYPYSYVRWTENRNMQEYLQLLSKNKINIEPLIDKIYKLEESPEAYDLLKSKQKKPMIVLLEYNKESKPDRKIIIGKSIIKHDRINVGIIGAGSFVQDRHLPNLIRLKNIYNLKAVCCKTGGNARSIAELYNASYATTDYKEILADDSVDMVFITTRHKLHAAMAVDAAKAGKAVFMEKPMALNEKELNKLVNILKKTGIPFFVGFNRRFSPFSKKIKELIADRLNPMIIDYRINAGFIPLDNWVHSEGGGRNIGEACHIYDLFNFLTDSKMSSIKAHSISPKTEQYGSSDNFTASIKYNDGSICNLIYTALGSSEIAKEKMDIYVDGIIISLNDFKKLKIFGRNINGMKSKIQNKGLFEELYEFGMGLRKGKSYIIPLWQLIQATEISFEVEKQINY